MAATLSDVLAEIFGLQATPPPNLDVINRPDAIRFGANAGRAMSGPAGPPVPTERQAMPQNVTEPLSVPVPDVPSTYPGPALPEGADNPMLAAFKRLFATQPQPPDGMDAATYQPGRKMPTGADWSPPTVTVDPRRPAAPAVGGGPLPSVPGIDVAAPGEGSPNMGDRFRDLFRTRGSEVPRRPMTLDVGSVPRNAVPSRAPSSPTAPAGNPNEDIARTFRNFFQGAASVDPSSPKFSAFAQGAAGSMTANYKEKQAEEQRKAQLARQGFEDDLKVGKARRDDALANSLIKLRGAKAAGDPAGVRYQDINAYNQVKNNVQRDYKRALDLIGKDVALTPVEKKKAQDEARVERDARLTEIEQQYKQRTLTPDMSRAAPASRPGPGAAPPAVGAVDDGWKFKGGDPADRNNWELVK